MMNRSLSLVIQNRILSQSYQQPGCYKLTLVEFLIRILYNNIDNNNNYYMNNYNYYNILNNNKQNILHIRRKTVESSKLEFFRKRSSYYYNALKKVSRTFQTFIEFMVFQITGRLDHRLSFALRAEVNMDIDSPNFIGARH